MLERHARVKMSRMNALNSFVVFLMALYSRTFEPAILENSLIRKPHVSFLVLFVSLLGTLMFAFEFYQRQCWFGDIVLKISASLSRLEKDERS